MIGAVLLIFSSYWFVGILVFAFVFPYWIEYAKKYAKEDETEYDDSTITQ